MVGRRPSLFPREGRGGDGGGPCRRDEGESLVQSKPDISKKNPPYYTAEYAPRHAPFRRPTNRYTRRAYCRAVFRHFGYTALDFITKTEHGKKFLKRMQELGEKGQGDIRREIS